MVWEIQQRQIHTQILAATLAAAMGAEVEIPDEDAIRAEWEEALAAEPEAALIDPDQLVLRRALGLSDK